MRRLLVVSALLLGSCNYSEGPGCHYVRCEKYRQEWSDDRYLCSVWVDGRPISTHWSGQDAMDFIRRNDLKQCRR